MEFSDGEVANRITLNPGKSAQLSFVFQIPEDVPADQLQFQLLDMAPVPLSEPMDEKVMTDPKREQ